MDKSTDPIEKGIWHTIGVRDASKDGSCWRPVPGAVMPIHQAKSYYDNGELEMMQRRDGGSFLLMICLRQKRDARRIAWFFKPEADFEAELEAKRKELARRRINYPSSRRSPARRETVL